MRAGALLILGLLAAPVQAAPDDPICPDRPGKSTGTCTVPAGHWQVETGLADWTRDASGGVRSTGVALGETIFKYGLSDRSDIEIDVTPWQRVTARGAGLREHASGFGDITLLYKHRLTADGAAIELALLPFVKAPTAKHQLGNGKWESGMLLPISYAVGETPLSLAMTPELDWAADADGRGHHAAMAQVATLGWQATKRLNLSAELWGQWDWDPSGTVRQLSGDAAAAYLIRSDVQLDAGVNLGLNRRTPDVEIYAGVAKRF